MSRKKEDRDLGMGRRITRRDFLNGVAVSAGVGFLGGKSALASLASGPDEMTRALDSEKGADATAEEHFLSKGITQQNASYYPPGLTDMMRGSHPGSFEAAHLLRDHRFWKAAGSTQDTGETYDLVVVGGGISGLAAAHFFRQSAGQNARILILENHDDFGGHAKRNEFTGDGRLLLGYGGTQSIESPGSYSPQAIGLLRDVGIDVSRFYHYFDRKLYSSLGLRPSIFFDKATFGTDRLLVGAAVEFDPDSEPLPASQVNQMPIAPAARRDLLRLLNGSVNYLPGLTPDQLRVKLTKTSYKDFLLQDAKVHPDVVKLYQQAPHDLYCVGIDAVSALACRFMGYPGFKGIPMEERRRRNEKEEPYIFHFPDGNASVARLLVRSLVPGSIPGHTMEDVVTARVDYPRLDQPDSQVRLRLNSTVVRARHSGDPQTAKAVDVTYMRDGKLYSVRAGYCVMACYNCMVPYLCPDMPALQKEALAYAVKEPLVYTNVQIVNWTSFQKLRADRVYCPGSYFSNVDLDFPVSLGSYRFPSSPSESCILHLLRTPCRPGLPCKEQYKAGRWELYTTPFSTFERNIRAQLGDILGGGGFDAARDILAITVNRWPHGYAYEYNPLFEPLDRPESERPCVIGRRPFGRITIANSDSDGHAYTNIAIDQAYRAIQETMALKSKSTASGAPTGLAVPESAANV
ncbi:MAG: NAD(P)-binding protein [Candidatus Sulfotelmatobacter sp.]